MSTKEELLEIINTTDKIHRLADKYFTVVKWMTNVSMALLGFYIALLLQLKFNNNDIATFFSIAVLVTLILSVLVGILYNLIYEALDISHRQKIMQQVYDLNYREDEFEADESIKSISSNKLKMISHYWVGTYFVIFLCSLSGVTAYLVRVLFFE